MCSIRSAHVAYLLRSFGCNQVTVLTRGIESGVEKISNKQRSRIGGCSRTKYKEKSTSEPRSTERKQECRYEREKGTQQQKTINDSSSSKVEKKNGKLLNNSDDGVG